MLLTTSKYLLMSKLKKYHHHIFKNNIFLAKELYCCHLLFTAFKAIFLLSQSLNEKNTLMVFDKAH
ncbi:MAG: hypothetical protein L6U99_10305 [Clostridium sp.]|nr:MAG: hypothetical protein L6U99_10305 [Clostridium sp.]